MVLPDMESNLPDFLAAPPISGITINNVWMTPDVRTWLYIAMAGVLAAGIMLFLAKRHSFTSAFRKSVLLVFFITGILAAVRADIGWSEWIVRDQGTYGGLTTDQKLLRMEGGLYDFVQRARTVVTGDYSLYSSDSYLPLRCEYFLLPLRKRENAPIIIVLVDNQAQYDQKRRVFTRGATVITNVDLLFTYSPQAYILKRS